MAQGAKQAAGAEPPAQQSGQETAQEQTFHRMTGEPVRRLVCVLPCRRS